VSPLRWILVALLVASTALFAVGAIAERSSRDTHTEAAEPAGAHSEGGQSSDTGSGETGHVELRPSPASHTPRESVCSASMSSPPRW
jgi:hypothetical protein